MYIIGLCGGSLYAVDNRFDFADCTLFIVYLYDIMLLLTNCEVHTGKYSNRSLDVRTERSEVRTKN